MALNIRRVGEVADNSVTAEKIADGAVDLSTAKVTGELPTTKLANGAVNESKLADLAVATAKLQNNAVTLAKADDDVKVSNYVGDESEVSVTGITETSVKEFQFATDEGVQDPEKMRLLVTMKNSDAGSEMDTTAGNVIELWYDPNGDGTGMEIIDVIFCSGDGDQHDLSASYLGDGTKAIRMRRRRFSGGSKEIFGRWEGYF